MLLASQPREGGLTLTWSSQLLKTWQGKSEFEPAAETPLAIHVWPGRQASLNFLLVSFQQGGCQSSKRCYRTDQGRAEASLGMTPSSGQLCHHLSVTSQPVLLPLVVLSGPGWQHAPWAFTHCISSQEIRNGTMFLAVSFFSGEGWTPGLAQAERVPCHLVLALTRILAILTNVTENSSSWVSIWHKEGILGSPVTDLVLGSG